ncbi:MAG: sensor domain-containing diguanylate cyclase [Lachnospiraceae bacterium]
MKIKNKILFTTNILVCTIIIIGFTFTSIISYNSNVGIYEEDVERVSMLVSSGIYNDIASIFSQPVNVSLTMANDSLLKNFLSGEKDNLTNEAYLVEMQHYLDGYREKYSYDSVFLVSTYTNRYYHFNGIDRILISDNAENNWYYDFLKSNEEYSLNVDNDEATEANTITVFVNCKIKNENGDIIGIVGVGMKVDSLQELLKGYEDKYGVHPYLIDKNGEIQISSSKTGYENTNLFDSVAYAGKKQDILENKENPKDFWYSTNQQDGYVISQYEPNLKWHLVIEHDTSAMSQRLNMQLYRNIMIILSIIILVLITITKVIKRYNSQIIKLTVSQELEYQNLLYEATQGLYENIFEFDITHNCAGGESTKKYFESLGISGDTSYDQALSYMANKQIKEEYRQEYMDIFSPQKILEDYKNGITNWSYDFMISENGEIYKWMKITARLFFWNSDKSIRMIAYRKNIDKEKRREFVLLDSVQKEFMTGLYNKQTTEQLVTSTFKEDIHTEQQHAFFIVDIDNFKEVNDTRGHRMGDHVIIELSAELKAQFREYDIVGRIGGDEFAVLMKHVDSMAALQNKMERLCNKINNKDFGQGESIHITCSIGVALFPKDGVTYSALFEKADQALYYAKGHGKNSFYIYQ